MNRQIVVTVQKNIQIEVEVQKNRKVVSEVVGVSKKVVEVASSVVVEEEIYYHLSLIHPFYDLILVLEVKIF